MVLKIYSFKNSKLNRLNLFASYADYCYDVRFLQLYEGVFMLRDDLKTAMKEAMKAKDTKRLSTVRLILAAVKEKDIANRTQDGDLGDDDVMITDILAKMVKQRGDSIKAYEEAGRCELAEQERSEIAIIQDFLPQQLSGDEIAGAVAQEIEKLGAASLKDIGRVMAALKSDYAGRMDFAVASGLVKEQLG